MSATREEVERILAEHKLNYQRVELPYGLSTPGKDRRRTANLALPDSLEGKTVLDIGCNIGFFCFEAERRGAKRVLGTEIEPDRVKEATLLKGVLDSDVEFELRDILGEQTGERFDVVLALNVIHHVTDPFAAIEKLADLTAWRLVIEFPTFAHPAIRRKNRGMWRLYNRRSLVGIRNLRSPTKLVLSPPAIKEGLLDDDGTPFFRSVRFHESPLPGRTLAICEKKR